MAWDNLLNVIVCRDSIPVSLQQVSLFTNHVGSLKAPLVVIVWSANRVNSDCPSKLD